jgi:hypothetical protein
VRDGELDPKAPEARRGIQAVMTAQLAGRQFLLLLAAATALLFMSMFINFYGVSFWRAWDSMDLLQWRFIAIHPLLLLIYGYVILSGVLFALGPSERGFAFFFGSMVLAVLVANYDHSIIDWFLGLFGGVRFQQRNPVSAFKILFAGLFFLVLIIMHYNVLADDFARRMLRRGVPTEEVAQIRSGMFKVLVPTVFTASAIAFGLAVLAEFSALVFQDSGLFLPKLQLFLLAALLVPIAFLIRGILLDLAGKRSGNER